MGKKISWEQAAKIGLKKDDRIVMPPNKYGYKININHPKIRSLLSPTQKDNHFRLMNFHTILRK